MKKLSNACVVTLSDRLKATFTLQRRGGAFEVKQNIGISRSAGSGTYLLISWNFVGSDFRKNISSTV